MLFAFVMNLDKKVSEVTTLLLALHGVQVNGKKFASAFT